MIYRLYKMLIFPPTTAQPTKKKKEDAMKYFVFSFVFAWRPWKTGKTELSHPSNLKIVLKMSKCCSGPQTTMYGGTYYMTNYPPKSMEILPLTSMNITPVVHNENRRETNLSAHERWCSPSSLSFGYRKAAKPALPPWCMIWCASEENFILKLSRRGGLNIPGKRSPECTLSLRRNISYWFPPREFKQGL